MLKLQYFGHLILRNWHIRNDPEAEKDWRQEEKGTTEDEMVGWHHWLNGHEFEQTLGAGEGQWSLTAAVHGVEESDMTERLNNNSNSFKKVLCSWLWDCYQRSPLLTPSHLGVRISTWILQETQTFRPQHLLFSVSLFTTLDSPGLKRYPGRSALFLFCPLMEMGLMNCSMGFQSQETNKKRKC